jgi:hypothetical protein
MRSIVRWPRPGNSLRRYRERPKRKAFVAISAFDKDPSLIAALRAGGLRAAR